MGKNNMQGDSKLIVKEEDTIDEHAPMAPSSAKRWINCPGSVYMSSLCPKPPSSKYAKEGTNAHCLAEKVLSDWLICDRDLMSSFQVHAPLFPDKEMKDYILEYVLTIARLMMKTNPERVALEQKFYLVPGVNWGKPDVAWKYTNAKGEKNLVVIDLKYGQGYAVDIHDGKDPNPQLVNYALCIDETENWGPFDAAEIFIYQPRAEHIDGPLRCLKIGKEKLAQQREVLLRAIEKAQVQLETKQPTLFAGSHCQWCPAIAVCKEHASYESNRAGMDFTEITAELQIIERRGAINLDVISDEQLAKIVLARKDIEAYLKRCGEYATNTLLSGRKIEGLKLVHGRESRRWKPDQELIVETLTKYKIAPFKEPEIVNLTDAEKELIKTGSKSTAERIMASLTDKPEGSLKVVSVLDKRVEVESLGIAASRDFTEVEGEGD